MSRRFRLIQLIFTLSLLLLLGRILTGSFNYILQDFWFAAGFLLLLLFSLIDQPFFSKESNVFINAITAGMSLIIIPFEQRHIGWYLLFSVVIMLIILSYFLMWFRKNKMMEEPIIIILLSRLITRVGRPEVLFSLFFLWGVINKFGISSIEANVFFLFWAIFMILNVPAISKMLSNINIEKKPKEFSIGEVSSIIDPSTMFIKLYESFSQEDLYKMIDIKYKDTLFASGLIIDDRVLRNERIGKVAITNKGNAYQAISAVESESILAYLSEAKNSHAEGTPISIVDVGTELGKICFYVPPNLTLNEGEVVWVEIGSGKKGFYQIVNAKITVENMPYNNGIFYNQVIAGQLGTWSEDLCKFEPISWVPKAGDLIYRTSANTVSHTDIPCGHLQIGSVPNSIFPVHIKLEDIVTHNTAIIGVTGSGKSYLSFGIIEELSRNNIKVLILDMSRQHWIYLENNVVLTPLATKEDIEPWLNDSKSMVGIYQFANEVNSYPRATAEYVEAAFSEISKIKLKAGENEPARLCVVFEEAHSLIPEWNQVAIQSDVQQVNRTARFLLQGRKYGMGCLLITQRTANVTKTILNQCNTIFALQSFDQTGLDFLRNYMGVEYAHAISTLPVRHIVLVGKASSSTRPILFMVTDMSGKY